MTPFKAQPNRQRGFLLPSMRRPLIVPFLLISSFLAFFSAASTASAAGTVAWTVRGVAVPSNFSSGNTAVCERERKCDRYQLLVMNAGDEASSGPITLTDKLPPGITTLETPGSGGGTEEQEEKRWACTEGEGNSMVTCTFEGPVAAGKFAPFLTIVVSAPTATMEKEALETRAPLKNEVTVEGGGAAASASTSQETSVGSQPLSFGVTEFELAPDGVGGAPALQAGGHPWELTASFGVPSVVSPPGNLSEGVGGAFTPVRNVKSALVELPAGFFGDPQATAHCTETELRDESCPPGSRVGVYALAGDIFSDDEFLFTEAAESGPCCSAVYNMVPEAGYPAEFGFTFARLPVYMYASVVHTATGYRLRVAAPGIPPEAEATNAAITFFGEPGALNGTGSEEAFLTSPDDCAAGALPSTIELESWGEPGHPISRQATAYSQITGCNQLQSQFHPKLELAPSSAAEHGTSQADEPSGYTASLEVPQTSKVSELATPELREATVTLPQGVSVSPSAAQGLVGCQAEGPEGINIGSDKIGPGGRDEGDPEATELGAGHAGGNGSPYDDGLYHTARGHCPGASTLGTVEVFTPLLPTRCGGENQSACRPGESPAPLQGHVYLAQPKCGGAGQPECTEASATNGELFGLYIEAEGSGVILKLPGTVAASPQTGQLTGTFKENPQLPFSDLKLRFHGGPRAPLANPQSCGSFATTSILSSWAGQEVSEASPAFSVDWDGKGGGCPASLPFGPGFTAGTTRPTAGTFTPFTLTLSRQDREQDLSGLSVTLPPGLLGKIAGVPLCGEAQANAGTCGSESQIGTTSVTAGSGEDPLYVPGGRVYLTTGYKGQPFGLSIVVPAVAGPFNLGNVVVRSAIHIDPNTAQVTVISDPLPQSKDGVPFRLRTVNVEINRAGGFTFNPTDCAQQPITATITGAQGATAAVSSPFAVTGCASLPFKPSFTASTQAKTSKTDGASLVVKVTQKPGEANIHKVDLQLPLALPSRLTTLQKACTEAQFNANPAGCPEGSVIGVATAHTPVLNAPLTGPAILVSHGGAAFPDVEFLLQGEGVEIVLDGKTDIKKGITYSMFETVPDAPISSFETILPEGPHSVLAAYGSLCSQTLVMPTTIAGQNGAQVTQSTSVAVTGCGKPSIKINKATIKGNTVLVRVTTSQPGTVTVSGSGLKRTRETLGAGGTHQLKVSLTKNGRSARKRHRKTKVKASVKDSNGSSSRTITLKL